MSSSDWRDRAACRDYFPELFVANGATYLEEAKVFARLLGRRWTRRAIALRLGVEMCVVDRAAAAHRAKLRDGAAA